MIVMETLEKKHKEKKFREGKECPHIYFKIIDSGMLLSGEKGRDIGLGCEDCGLAWDVCLYRGSSKATIRLRQSGAEEYESNKDLLNSFIAYLKAHEYLICFYDAERKKPRAESVKGYYPISYDEDSIEGRLDSFLKEFRKTQSCQV